MHSRMRVVSWHKHKRRDQATEAADQPNLKEMEIESCHGSLGPGKMLICQSRSQTLAVHAHSTMVNFERDQSPVRALHAVWGVGVLRRKAAAFPLLTFMVKTIQANNNTCMCNCFCADCKICVVLAKALRFVHMAVEPVAPSSGVEKSQSGEEICRNATITGNENKRRK